MSEVQPVRIGIVGAGRNTRDRHIPGLQAITGVKIVSVCNRSRESSQKAADTFGIPRIEENWSDLVASDEIDAVVIGTWPYMHCPITLAALKANKHVLCEARMAMNAAEAHEMFTASCAKPNLVTQLVPSPLTLEVDRTIVSLISEGVLGEVLMVDIRDGNGFIDRSSELHWRQDRSLSGFNTLSLGIWYEALMRWLGPARSVSAGARIFTKIRKDERGNMRAIEVPDHLDVIGELYCGTQIHMQLSAVTGAAGPGHATIYGSEATLIFRGSTLFMAARDNSEFHKVPIPEEKKGAWRVEEEFIGAIRGREKVRLTTFEDGVKYMEFTEAVYRSSVSGNAVLLPLCGGD